MTREEFGDAIPSNSEEGKIITTGIVARVLELWPSAGFARDWNGANREIAFKKLSTFAQHEVLDVLENYRYDNPDAREPKFAEIAAKLWNVRKSRAAKKEGGEPTSLPPWCTIEAWAGRKSDDDLDHLWQVVTERYQLVVNNHDNLWQYLNSCDRRSAAFLKIAWAIEHNVELTFKRGTDEWHAVMDEHSRQQVAKEVEQYSGRGRPDAAKLEPYPQETGRTH